MTKRESATFVSSALKNGTLPSYLKSFFWEAARHNLYTYLLERKKYLAAVYCLAETCYIDCFRYDDYGRKTFKIGFPDTPDQLKKIVDLGLVQAASEVIALQRIGLMGEWAARRYFATVFDAAKLLGLIAKDATYEPYFKRGNTIADNTEAQMREAHRICIM